MFHWSQKSQWATLAGQVTVRSQVALIRHGKDEGDDNCIDDEPTDIKSQRNNRSPEKRSTLHVIWMADCIALVAWILLMKPANRVAHLHESTHRKKQQY